MFITKWANYIKNFENIKGMEGIHLSFFLLTSDLLHFTYSIKKVHSSCQFVTKRNKKRSPQQSCLEKERRKKRSHPIKMLASGRHATIARSHSWVSLFSSQSLSHLIPFTAPSDSYTSSCESRILGIIEKAKKGGIIRLSEYNEVLNFTVSHLYVANPQSRIGAISRMTLSQHQELQMSGHLACTDFKTWQSYEAQFINACPASRLYLFILFLLYPLTF